MEEISPGCLVFPVKTSYDALEPGSPFTAPNKVVAVLGRGDVEEEIRTEITKRLDELWRSARDQIKNSKVEIESEGATIPGLKVKQLKDFIRQKAKEEKLLAGVFNPINEALRSE